MSDDVEIHNNRIVINNEEMLARMAVKSLMSCPYQIFMRDLIDHRGKNLGQALTIRIDVGNSQNAERYQSAIRELSLDVGAFEVGIMSISSAHSIRRLVELGFDTGSNEELFPDLEKSKIDPSRFK